MRAAAPAVGVPQCRQRFPRLIAKLLYD